MERLTGDRLTLQAKDITDRWESRFGLSRMLDTPTVVFDLSTEFWPIFSKSKRMQEGLEKVERGDLIPANAYYFGVLAQNHDVWQEHLSQEGIIPIIPTYIRKEGFLRRTKTKKLMSTAHVSCIPNIYVHKQSVDESGKSLQHRGAGITILKISDSDLRHTLPQREGEFLQQFILPPKDNTGNVFVRDIRVFMVGGKPVHGIVRRAEKPLTVENIRGTVAPEINQIYSARHKGPKERLEGELKERIFQAAEQVEQNFVKILSGSEFRYLSSRYSPTGFMSVDFLLDEQWTPLPVDCDIQPGVDTFQNTQNIVAEHIAEYLGEIAKIDGKERQIVVVGIAKEQFTQAVFHKTRKAYGRDTTFFQECILSQLINAPRLSL